MSPDDDLARLRAEMDQAKEALKEVAGNLWAFFNELTEQGFDKKQALVLTSTFLSSGIGANTGGDSD